MSTQPLASTGRIREPGVYAAPSLTFDLDDEIRLLQAEQPWQAGHTAKTIVKYPDLRIVLIALKAGGRMVQHETTGRISIHALSGYLKVRLPDKILELPTGGIVALDKDVPHSVEAVVNSAFLLTIAWPDGDEIAVRPENRRYRQLAETERPDLRIVVDARPRSPRVTSKNEPHVACGRETR